jgi:hypothetical protein
LTPHHNPSGVNLKNPYQTKGKNMRNKMLVVATIIFVSISSLLVLNVRARKAAQEAQETKPVPTALPSAVKALSVSRIEWISNDSVNVHIRNDSGRPILGFTIAHDEAEEERPTHDGSYTTITYFRRFEPNPLQPGLEEVVSQAANEPIRLAAVLYDDGTVEGDRRAGKYLLQDKKKFETDLTASLAALREMKARAKTKQELEQALARFLRDNLPVQQTTFTPTAELQVPIITSTISPGTHPASAKMLSDLAQANSPDVAIDEFIRLAEIRLGQAQSGGEEKRWNTCSSEKISR